MKVKEAKKIRFNWVKTFRTGLVEDARDDIAAREFCTVLRRNGITYEMGKSTFGEPRVTFKASFKEISNLAELLDLEFENLRCYMR